LLRAHYEGAVPLDLLKTEMHRPSAMAAAEKQANVAQAEAADVEAVLEQALTVAGSCALHYEAAPERIRRQRTRGSSTSCGSGKTAAWSWPR
jgi:site-specific DNA recombinase